VKYEYKHLEYPNYISYSPGGHSIAEMRCKGCGIPIAQVRDIETRTITESHRALDRPKTIRQEVRIFKRLENYTELKIEFENGTFHVTNGCAGCLIEDISVEKLRELLIADVEMSPEGFRQRDIDRVVKGVAQIKRGAGGIA